MFTSNVDTLVLARAGNPFFGTIFVSSSLHISHLKEQVLSAYNGTEKPISAALMNYVSRCVFRSVVSEP
jgi:hypothetical protein